MTKLLQKDGFQWDESATEAFEKLKRALTQITVLALPDFSKEFIVETDASNIGIGTFLLKMASLWLTSARLWGQ